jgi:hypothetical protein
VHRHRAAATAADAATAAVPPLTLPPTSRWRAAANADVALSCCRHRR